MGSHDQYIALHTKVYVHQLASGKMTGSLGLSGLSGGSPSLRSNKEGRAQRAQRAGHFP